MSDYVPLTEHAELELRAEIERLRDECQTFITSNGGLTADLLIAQDKLADTAAFLDRMATRYERHLVGSYAADCRAMAKRLRGET